MSGFLCEQKKIKILTKYFKFSNFFFLSSIVEFSKYKVSILLIETLNLLYLIFGLISIKLGQYTSVNHFW